MRRLRRVGYARKTAILVKPAIDDRYSVDEVVSHEGQRMAARVVRTPDSILQLAAGVDAVGVDEGQFLDDSLIDVCEELVDAGVRVVIAGLDMTYRQEPFGPMPRLLAMADEVAKLKAVCHGCGEAAMYTQRLVDGAPAPFSGDWNGGDPRPGPREPAAPRLLPARAAPAMSVAAAGKDRPVPMAHTCLDQSL
jgi:thymidine kinase